MVLKKVTQFHHPHMTFTPHHSPTHKRARADTHTLTLRLNAIRMSRQSVRGCCLFRREVDRSTKWQVSPALLPSRKLFFFFFFLTRAHERKPVKLRGSSFIPTSAVSSRKGRRRRKTGKSFAEHSRGRNSCALKVSRRVAEP